MNNTETTQKGRCKVCAEYKERIIENFAQARLTKDGLSNTCKVCQRAITKHKAEVYAQNRDKRAREKKVNKTLSVKEVRQPIKLKPQSELDRLFSLIIRTAHPKFCHSCGVPHEIKEAQAGHIINRTKFAVRYDLRNALPVCCACNYFVENHT